ncbi:MAG TPA: GPW/gp25 family protein [Bryobacteraceae bacterium]|nr:GPW/gp25 family protein [Bryobacteraceae bacterium]
MKTDFLGTGWKFPIRVNPRGGISFSRAEQKIQESIWLILATAPGERQMRPQFGCGIHSYVFAPNNTATQGHIAHEVRRALTNFEPRIDVQEVRVDSVAASLNQLLIRVDYRIRSTNVVQNLVYPFFLTEGIGG